MVYFDRIEFLVFFFVALVVAWNEKIMDDDVFDAPRANIFFFIFSVIIRCQSLDCAFIMHSRERYRIP